MARKVGLVLSGGGVRGSYQMGAYLALYKNGIRFNAVVGTSIGSFNAAMIAANQAKKLLKFWENIDMTKFLEIDPVLTTKGIDKETVVAFAKTLKEKLNNNGFNIKPLKDELGNLLNEKKLRRSNIDFGLVTLNTETKKPLKVFLKDMPKGTVIDHILASCYLPVFKKEKLIDDNYYLDGGFIDNCPVEMLESLGYKNIYVINLKAIGITRKTNTKVIEIKPSRNLGSILATNQELIRNNIKLGYYDTLKVLNKLDGLDYNIKIKSKKYYQRLLRRINKEELLKAEEYYKTNNPKKLLIRMFEYILRNENKEVYHIYKPRDIIKITKKQSDKRNFQYDFVRKLK
jgi:NTE family protein